MTHDDLEALAESILHGSAAHTDFAQALLAGLHAAFPDHAARLGAEVLTSTEVALSLAVRQFPNWTIKLKGKAAMPDGHWTCSLRETSARDDDEVVGVGRADTLPLALLAAMLLAQSRRLQGYV